MSDEMKKPKLEEDAPSVQAAADDEAAAKLKLVLVSDDELDEDEREFRAIRQDIPGVQGASAIGIVAIGVAKNPGKNAFFRTHPGFHPVVGVVDLEVGMEQTFFAVTKSMEAALAGIGITVTAHTLYLTVTSTGAVRVVPVRCANADGDQNEYSRTKELGLRAGEKQWVRLFTDRENSCYRVYPAPADRYAEPIWPELTPAKIFRLAFRDKGHLVDSVQHPLFLKWAARDYEDQ
jgi:hypothetical protein